MRLAMVVLSILIGGCAGQQWIIKEIAPQPPTIFVTGVDYTSTAADFNLTPLVERVKERLNEPEVDVVFTLEEQGQAFKFDQIFPNPFTFADSSHATVVITADVSLLEYASKKSFRSKADALGEMFLWGVAGALLTDEKIAGIMADVTISTSDRVLFEGTILGLSESGLSPRKSIEQAIDNAADEVLGKLLHY